MILCFDEIHSIDIYLRCDKICVLGETEAAPQGCDRQGIAGLDCDGKSLRGGINLPSFPKR